MKMRESALWRSVRKHIPAGCMAERIENSVGSGMPDTLVTGRGKTFLVELKAELDITPKQADWARRWADSGGKSWFLIAMSNAHYLVPGRQGGWLISHPTEIYKWRVDGVRAAIDKMFE